MKSKLTASCGCGWFVQASISSEGAIQLRPFFTEVNNHIDAKGHTIDISGVLRPPEER